VHRDEVAEQYTLSWENIDLVSTNKFTLPLTKRGERQYVTMNSAARKALAKLRARYPQAKLVCPSAGYYNDFKRKFWEPVVTKAKITDFHWHDLRHTFASRLVMAGVDIFTVSKLLRHDEVGSTERYAHLSTPHLAAASERLVETPSVTESVQEPAVQKQIARTPTVSTLVLKPIQ
jgi:integrase